MQGGHIPCWELMDRRDPLLARVRELFEATIEPDERIPWEWVAQAAATRRTWRPGRWSPHLLVAASGEGEAAARAVGFAYGMHVPSYGGYACYLGVDHAFRRRGIAARLLGLLVRVLELDAAFEGDALPFVVWESRRPAADSEAATALWQARLRLFGRLGARRVAGIRFHAPNFAQPGGPPVPLELFLLPVGTPAESFTEPRLHTVVAGLLERVYGRAPGDPLFDRSLPAGCRPSLAAPDSG